MKKLVIKRERKLASALMSYWVVTGMPRHEFLYNFKLKDDRYRLGEVESRYGGTADKRTRVSIKALDAIGVKLENGQTVTTEIGDDVTTVFACTYDGWVTEEIALDKYLKADGHYELCLSTKGGFLETSYPYFKKV